MDSLVKLDEKLVAPASLTAARAFKDDPETAYLIPDVNKRENTQYAFRYLLKIAVVGGEEAYVSSPQCEGVALWARSDNKMPFRAWLSANPLSALRCGWRFISHQMEANRIAQDIKKKYAPPKHMYLALLGVEPVHQGKGFASKLLKPMLARLDKENLAAYVETQNTKNVKMYEHFGFKLVYDVATLNGVGHLYAMVREPIKIT